MHSMKGKKSHLKHGCKATARRAEVSGLALVYPCSDEQSFSAVGVKANIDFPSGYSAVNSHGSFPRRDEFLRDIVALQNVVENTPGQLVAAVYALAAMAGNRLEEKFTPGTPQFPCVACCNQPGLGYGALQISGLNFAESPVAKGRGVGE